MAPIHKEKTIPYKTYIKTAIVQALRPVFQNHPDTLLDDKVKVSIENPTTEADYPAIVIRFQEDAIKNIGVGHREYFWDEDAEKFAKFKHYYFHGALEFVVYALSSKSRDLVTDALVQTITMGDLAGYTNAFFARIYTKNYTQFPDSKYNFIKMNTDELQPSGETQIETSWGERAGNQFLYQSAYRLEVEGEFYSLPPENPQYGLIEKVNVYPYLQDIEPVPEGTDDPSPWLSMGGDDPFEPG